MSFGRLLVGQRPHQEVQIMRRVAIVIAIGIVVAAAASLVVARGNQLPPEVQAVKASTARFQSVGQAEAAGYAAASPCEESPDGAMGIHYVNGSLVGDPSVDPLHPEILLYVPDANGKPRLVGVEYFVIDADQDKATDADRPTVLGRGFDGPMDGHAPGMPIHYDLHVWLFESNPSGLFAPWNPALDCPATAVTMAGRTRAVGP
jgi:hypothetical protein